MHSGQAPMDLTEVSPLHWCFSSRRCSSAISARRRGTSSSVISGRILMSKDHAAPSVSMPAAEARDRAWPTYENIHVSMANNPT